MASPLPDSSFVVQKGATKQSQIPICGCSSLSSPTPLTATLSLMCVGSL